MKTISLKISKELHEALEKSVPSGERSVFIRRAIEERLAQRSAVSLFYPLKILEELEARIEVLDQRLRRLEGGASAVSQQFSLPQGLSEICGDAVDRAIVDHFLRYGCATTRELEPATGIKRRQILKRVLEINRRYRQKMGRPLLRFERGKIRGKRQAWWLQPAEGP